MEELENKHKVRQKRRDVTSFILNVVGGAGYIGIALVVPNVLGAMHKLGLIPTGRQKEVINRARDRLLRKGLLERHDGKLSLTEKGERRFRILEAQTILAHAPKRWDGKWRVLLFDIPEKRKGLRNKIRDTLRAAGFVRLQDSAWVYPYDCEEYITLLKAEVRIGKELLYMIVYELEGDRWLRQEFDLH